MSFNKKWFLLSSILVALTALPACTTMDYFLGTPRTLPEDANVTFGTPHPPVLNPSGQSIGAKPVSDSSGSSSGRSFSGRRVPIENNVASENINIAPVAVMPSAEPTASVAPIIPVTTVSQSAPAVAPVTIPATASAKSTPAGSFAPIPVTTASQSTPVVIPAAIPAATTPQSALVVTSVAPSATAPKVLLPAKSSTLSTASNDNSYPTLSDVPAAPVRPNKAQTTADFNAMAADHTASESQRQQLMNDPNATVMTSPQTGRLIDNAADAQAVPVPPTPVVTSHIAPMAAAQPAPATPVVKQKVADTSSNGGFNSWLHNMFSSDDKSAKTKPADNNAVANASTVPPATSDVHTPRPALFHSDASAPAPTPPATASALTPMPAATPAVAASVPAPAAPKTEAHLQPLPAPVAVPPAPPVVATVQPTTGSATSSAESKAALEPVHLHPPTSVASTDPNATYINPTPTIASSQSVNLNAPSAAVNSQVRYLNDSRYAERREQDVPADNTSD